MKLNTLGVFFYVRLEEDASFVKSRRKAMIDNIVSSTESPEARAAIQRLMET